MPDQRRPSLQPLQRQGLVLVVSVLVGATGWMLPGALQQWELALTGLALEWRGIRTPKAPVAIVAIDDFSLMQAANGDLSQDTRLRQLQQWPWPRAVHAMVLERLVAAGVRAVAFDLLFDTPSSHSPADDAAMAAALQRHRGRTVLGATVLESKGKDATASLTLPLNLFSQAAGGRAIGLLDAAEEADGSIRGRPGDHDNQLRGELGEAVPPSLGESLLQISGQRDRAAEPFLPGSWQAQLDLYGPPRTIPTIPIWNVLETGAYRQLVASGTLRNKLVFVGTTADQLQDLHRTPFSGGEGMPGVELHATELANRLEGRALWQWRLGREWGAALGLIALTMGLLAQRWEKPLQRLMAVGGFGLGLGLLGVVGVGTIGLAPNLFGSAAVVSLMAVVTSGEATVRLQWQRRRLRQALGRYLSPAVAAEIANQPAEADGLLGGRSTNVVVLMTDIRGFTARTRAMGEQGRARELVDQLNAYFTEVVDALHGEGATVDKFIGDATLAVFGAPLHRGDQEEAAAALRAALEIRNRMVLLNTRWLAEGREPWKQVIVLHFGPVISGNVGSSSRMDYTVIGDGVNTASRLESVAKQCNKELVMSGTFAVLLKQVDQLEDLGEFELRGHGVESVYTLRGMTQ